MTSICKGIIEFLACDYELFENEKDDVTLIARWNALTKESKETGAFYPLIVVPSDVLLEAIEIALEDYELENTPEGVQKLRETILAQSLEVNVDDILKNRLDEYMEMHADMDALGSFRECQPSNCFFSYMLGRNIAPEIILAKIPAKAPWELAAWIPMGGFNDCPVPAQQAAVFRHWYHQYKANPAVVTYDNWEMELASPPKTPEEAFPLAKEHFAFCYDIVMQAEPGFDSVKALASTLSGSTTWFFWWD